MLSLIFATALWAAWGRTWFAQDTFQRYGWVEEDQRFVSQGLAWSDGRLSVWFNALDPDSSASVADDTIKSRFRSSPVDRNAWSWSWLTWEWEPPRPVLSVGSWRVPGQYSSWTGGVRIWPAAVVASVLPALWVWRFVRARRIRLEGLCPTCQYDLRATPSRCPECGFEPQPAQRFSAGAGV